MQSTRNHIATEKLGSETNGKQLKSWASQAISKQGMVDTTENYRTPAILGTARNQGEQVREWCQHVPNLISAFFKGKELQKIHRDRAVASVGASQADMIIGEGEASGAQLWSATLLSTGMETGGVKTMLVGRRTTIPPRKRPTLAQYAVNHQGVLTHVLRGDIQTRRIVLSAWQRVFISRTIIVCDVKFLHVRGTGSS